MKTRETLTAITLAMGLGLAGTAMADPTATAVAADTPDDIDICQTKVYFQQVDYDDDGTIDEAEYKKIGEEWFRVWDQDENAAISVTEFTHCYDAWGWDLGDGLYDTLDVNKDGQLVQQEFFISDTYVIWDKNENGVIDINEMHMTIETDDMSTNDAENVN